jgi:glycerol kinase
MSDCSPLGAAFAGLIGLGVYRSLDDIAAMPLEEISYHTAMSPDRVQHLLSGWHQAVRQTIIPPA